MELLSHLRKHYCTFDKILAEEKVAVSKLGESKRQKIKEQLDHGVAIIESNQQMSVYIDAYGAIHKAKLDLAFERLPHKVYSEGQLSVVDYGCGQGIASMVFAEHMCNHYQDIDKVKELLLIEPSTICLNRAVVHARRFMPNAQIGKLNVTANELWKWQFNITSHTVIHLFSNVVDIPDFPREIVADKLNQDGSHNNIVVCVSPFYPENGRGKHMDEFGSRLTNYICAYSFEKHSDEWNNDFSCQIRIYVSRFY